MKTLLLIFSLMSALHNGYAQTKEHPKRDTTVLIGRNGYIVIDDGSCCDMWIDIDYKTKKPIDTSYVCCQDSTRFPGGHYPLTRKHKRKPKTPQ
jgi:hypothetical protein